MSLSSANFDDTQFLFDLTNHLSLALPFGPSALLAGGPALCQQADQRLTAEWAKPPLATFVMRFAARLVLQSNISVLTWYDFVILSLRYVEEKNRFRANEDAIPRATRPLQELLLRPDAVWHPGRNKNALAQCNLKTAIKKIARSPDDQYLACESQDGRHGLEDEASRPVSGTEKAGRNYTAKILLRRSMQ